ncbi:Proton myo-inositol cotransporter [Frankliniella fusca]|uniref:Proton myo-inositol cotransporter n=1 Tax=Frankliniella fusca TaxID=407009 RepID=A0AAE1GUH5_9NEOP|nr:Proton myo-inositol cotransporter [Frankliniella fusca]
MCAPRTDAVEVHSVPEAHGHTHSFTDHLFRFTHDDFRHGFRHDEEEDAYATMTGPMVVDSKGGAAVADNSKMTALAMVLVALSANSGLLFGYDTGVVSGAMLLIKKEMNLDTFWQELIVSGTIGAAWAFSLCGGYLTDKWGRRRTILTAAVVFAAGSVVMGVAGNKEVLLAGRIIVGVGVGLATMSTPMYMAECCAPRYRGTLVMLYTLGTTGGQFVAGIISGLFSEVDNGWRWMLGLAAVPSTVLLVGFLFLPESPRWLIAQGRVDEAEDVLQRLRGADVSVHEELKGIRESCEADQRLKAELSNQNVPLRILKTPHARRALFLGAALMGYQQLAGINTAMYYSATIIKMAGIGDNSTAIWLSAVTAGVNCFCTIIGMFVVDRMGRRPLTLYSLLGAAISLAILGGGFLMMEHTAPKITETSCLAGACGALMTCGDCTSTHNTCGFCLLGNGTASCWPRDAESELALGGACMTPADGQLPAGAEWAVGYCPSDYSWVAVAGLVIYLFCFAPGMGPTPWVVNSEIHPMWARDVSSSIATSTNWLLNLVVSLSFLSLIDLIEAYGAFFLFAGITLTGVVLLWCIMPETKGLTLEEIQGLFGAEPEADRSNNNASQPDHKIQVVKTIEL